MEFTMSITTRRRFLHKAGVAAAAFCARPVRMVAAGLWAAREPNAAFLDAVAIRKFASLIGGQVITADAADYESSRLVFNRAFDQRPALIVRCAAPSDVARALEFAQKQNLPVAVRGGGHSRAGFGGCDGGMVIDLSKMKRIRVDAGKSAARAEAGSL